MVLEFGIFDVFIGKVKEYDNSNEYWSFDIFNVNWMGFGIILVLVNILMYLLGVYLGSYNSRNDYDKLVAKYNRYVELSQRESVAWDPLDDIPCKPGYKAEIVHEYSRENYRRLIQYGEQLTYSVVTNFIKIPSGNK